MSTITKFMEFKEIMRKNNVDRVFLFLGNGPKLQYKDITAVKSELNKTLDRTLNVQENCHQKRWMAIFGGDTFVEEKPDLGTVIFHVKEKYNPILVAVQCWAEFDPHVDYVWKYASEKNENGRTIYGGFLNEKPVGGTGIYLGEEMCQILEGVINVQAQGKVGSLELEYAKTKNLKIINVPALPKNTP